MTEIKLNRRELMTGMAAGMALAVSRTTVAQTSSPVLPVPPPHLTADKLARNEAFWAQVAGYYDRTSGIVNLEHGYWGKMARPVQSSYLSAIEMVNAQNSYYARKGYKADHQISVQRIARALAVHEDEIVLTRNATEAIHNLIRQYSGLKSGDAVLYADIDYPGFKTAMDWLGQSGGVNAIQIDLPVRANQQTLLNQYLEAFDANPTLKLILLTHVSNQHGMIIPVKKIAEEARKRGIDVICDNAQSWGLINYTLPDLGVDWVGFNLHKWMGAPVGVGALYLKRGSFNKIAPYPGKSDPDNNDASARVHMATANFAAMITVPEALDFHQAIGGANKEARLRYLENLWTSKVSDIDKIELLGGTDEASRTGMASFRLRGQTSIEEATRLQQTLENKFGVFTVIRKGLASGACVRITPQVFNTPDDVNKLVHALRAI